MPCKWPEKIKYASRTKALDAAFALRRQGKAKGGTSAYQCGDHWHVGHTLNRAIKEALGSGRTKFTKRRAH